MSRKKKQQPDTENKPKDRIGIYVAIIGLIGAVTVAILGILNTIIQLATPIIATKTAEVRQLTLTHIALQTATSFRPTAVPTNTTIASPEIGTDQIRINQVRRLVDEAGQFVGYEALVLNDSPQDTWVYSATLIVNAGQLLQDNCMSGDLDVLAKYFIHLSAKGEVTSTTQEGEQVQSPITGTITGDPSERYRVQGSLTYAFDCPFRSWLIEVNAPLNVFVPAHGHARIQLYFVIDESAVVERQVDTDVAEQLMAGGFFEQDKLVLGLQSGNDLEAVFEGELASLLINPIIKEALDK